MTIRLGLCGAAAALALMLLAPGPVTAQAVGSGVITSGDPVAGGMASSAFDPAFGPQAQDAAGHQSALSVRVYNARMEYARGFVDIQLGKFREAEGEFNNALQVHPDDMKSLFMLGMAKTGEGDLKGALQAFEKALKVNSQQIAVRREYAVTLARLGQADKAQAQLGMLKLRADACGGACPQAEEFSAAVARVEAALSGSLGAAG